MSEEYTIETRRRSRSKTPFLRSNCDHETCEHAGEEGHVHHHLKKKTIIAPNVRTIIEESVEVTSSSSAAKTSPTKASLFNQMQQIDAKTSDYSSGDVSPEKKYKKSIVTTAIDSNSQQQGREEQAYTSSTTTTTTVVTRQMGGTTVGGSLASATSTPKGNYSEAVDSFSKQFSSTGNRVSNSISGRGTAVSKELTQNKINTEYERLLKAAAETQSQIQTPTPNSKSKLSSLSRFFGNSFSSSANASSPATATSIHDINGDIRDHAAYLEYKRAGEYWKKTPKTDYTYSELSPHRRVLAGGFIGMPNMSRRSLENHNDRINYMINRDPAQEQYIRRRYESSKYAQNQRESMKLVYDSGDEIDQIDKSNYYYTGLKQQYRREELSWFMRIITTIVSSCSNAWSIVSGGFDDDDAGLRAYNSALYRTQYTKVERGFFGSILHGISSLFVGVLRYLYLIISSVLCLDTWLLRSSNPESRGKKRFLLLLLLLLPLLLLAGLYYYLHPNEPFPPKSFSEITFTLPTLPQINMSAYLNHAKYDEYRLQAYNRWSDFRDWTEDYLLYLRKVSENIADEGRKLFRREEHFERV